MNELDVWRAANILLKRYKADAVLIAAKRADALLEGKIATRLRILFQKHDNRRNRIGGK